MQRVNRRRAIATGAALAAMAMAAPAAEAVHWPFFGGDNGRSGYQPVDEGAVPLTFSYDKDEAGERPVRTSILTTTGAPAAQRLIFGTQNGNVHFQILASGVPVGPEAGTDIDEGDADADVFGTPGEGSVSFADTSGPTGLGQVFAVHNDDKATGGDIEIAQLDEADGGLVQQRVVEGTAGFTIDSSVVATGPATDGSRLLFFVAGDGAESRLFRVRVTNAATRGAGIEAATSTPDIAATTIASPTIVFINVAGTPTAHVAVGATSQLRTFRAADLAPGPFVNLPGQVRTPSVPVQPSGLTPNPADPVRTAPFIYVASDAMGRTRVFKIEPGDNTLTVRETSDDLGGVPAPALAVDQESTPDIVDEKVIVTTGVNLYLLSTADLGLAGQFDRDGRTPETTGFQNTTAAASGDFGYVTSDDSTQYVFRLSDGKPVPSDEFAQATGNPAAADTAFGQPSISRGFVQFAGGNGVFVYRNTDTADPTVSLTAPADGATISGTAVQITAQAFDTRGIASVRFRLNGQPIGDDTSPDSGSPFGAPGATYSTALNTTAIPNGNYVVDAVATDASGRTTTSAFRRVTIQNGAAAQGDDRPPTVAFTAPAAGTLVRGTTTVSATAADDRGIRAVAFFDDERLVCSDTTAPYSCTYTARGDDVGRNTLFAIATDTADQTGSSIRPVRVDRFAPASVTVRTTPTRDARAPFRFTTSGRLTLPSTVSTAAACDEGVVLVRFQAQRKTISTRRATLRSNCSYSSAVSFRDRRRFSRNGRLTVRVRFQGNDVLTARSAATRTVRTR